MSSSDADVVQGSPEWHALRCGKVTASRVASIVRTTRTGVSRERARYLGELVAQRLTGVVPPGYVNADMEWGTRTEDEAASAYAFYCDATPRRIGFVHHPRIAMSGASPDRLVGDDGLLEIKCPTTAVHIETLLGAPINPDYIVQMQWQMACTGRAWCDYVSYDPRMPEDLRLFCTRVARDPAHIMELERAVTAFLAEVDETVARLTALTRDDARHAATG